MEALPPSSAELVDALRGMRGYDTQTLNFVIPGCVLHNAEQFDARLEESSAITGLLQVGLSREACLAVNNVRLSGPGGPAGAGIQRLAS